jgi:hypothetical protein
VSVDAAEWLSQAAAAKLLGVSFDTVVRRLIADRDAWRGHAAPLLARVPILHDRATDIDASV